MWPFYLRPQEIFILPLHPPTLVCRSVCSSASPGMHLSAPSSAAKGWDSAMKRGESGVTRGWLSLVGGPSCCLILNAQQAFKEPQNLAEECLDVSLCQTAPSPHPFGWCLGRLSHSWGTENPWAERGICPREAQGEGGNPAQPLPRWDHGARSPAQAGEQGQGQPTGSKAPLAWPVQRENTL